ncbi:MAG: RNA polymerase sigma factor [Actinomycetia bacterium]|nr:RNA polymerase sigma factor [Actinomycetes bacterium]
MVHVLRRLGVAPDETEDVLQSIFLDVWRTAGRFSARRGPAAAWLYAIMRRRAIDHLRRSQRPTVPLDAVEVPAEAGDPAVPAEADEALGQLPPRERALLELLYFGGFTQAEIARAWGVPLGTVKTWTFRALAKLRRWDAQGDRHSGRGERS